VIGRSGDRVIENQKPNGTILMDKSMQKLVYQRLSAKISGKSFWFFRFAVLLTLASVFATPAKSPSSISQTSSDAVDLQELTRQAVSHYDQPADDDEKNAQAFLIKLWVDEKDREISKLEIKLIAEAKLFRTVLIVKAGGSEAQKSAGDPNEVYEPGTILGMEWTKINGEAWLPKSAHSKGKFRFLPARNIFPEEGEATYSDYKKFRVDTKVVPENSN
jgi:hypothetical protein